MLKTIITSLFLATLFSSAFSQVENSISGEIKNMPSTTLRLILEEDINRKTSRLIAEIPVEKNGKFKYRGKLAPHIYSLQLTDNRSLMLAIDKGQKLVIKGSMTGGIGWNISGSEDTKMLMDYETFRKTSLDRLVNSVRQNIRVLRQKGVPDTDTALLRLTKLEVDNYSLHRDELMHYIKNNMGTSLAIYPTSIRWGGEKNNLFLSRLAMEFEGAHRGTDIAKKVKEKVEVLLANSIGGKVSDINMPDTLGGVVTLSAIKAKFTLIDFWASWCLPCRTEAPLLNDLYQKYKPEGLEIYSVNMDSGREAWLRAINKDKRIWINVSTLQGFESTVAFDYAVTSLPSNILIDKTGRVVAKNLHGNELTQLIEKLFSN